MSTTVDERVVSMQFDNGQFERNASQSMSTLDKLKKALSTKGYKVTKTTSTNDTAKTTIINKSDIDTEFIDNIKSILGTENVSSNSVSSSDVDITIILGKDYK